MAGRVATVCAVSVRGMGQVPGAVHLLREPGWLGRSCCPVDEWRRHHITGMGLCAGIRSLRGAMGPTRFPRSWVGIRSGG